MEQGQVAGCVIFTPSPSPWTPAHWVPYHLRSEDDQDDRDGGVNQWNVTYPEC